MASQAEMDEMLRQAVYAYGETVVAEAEADRAHSTAVAAMNDARQALADATERKTNAKIKVQSIVEEIAHHPGDYVDETQRLIGDAVSDSGSYL